MLMFDSDTAHEHQELLSMINCIIGGKEFSIDVGIARIRKFLIMRAIERHGGNVAMAKRALGLEAETTNALREKPTKRTKAPSGRKKRPTAVLKE
jgi:hypothetical protein